MPMGLYDEFGFVLYAYVQGYDGRKEDIQVCLSMACYHVEIHLEVYETQRKRLIFYYQGMALMNIRNRGNCQ